MSFAGLPVRPLLGLDFTDASLEAVAAALSARGAGAPFGYVVTPNADHLVRLARDESLRPVYAGAMCRLLDSRVVHRIGRLLGLRMPHVVVGADLVAYLLRACLAPGEPVTIIGLDAAWLPDLVAQCGLAAPAHHCPPMGFDHDPAAMARAVDFVRSHPARFVLLAVGSPRQERLAAALAAAGVTGTGLCIGASLEFLAGARRRAPAWMQRMALEWLWRLGQEPRRLARRYLVDSPAILPMLVRERLKARGP